jgi:hypothetical protein
MFQATAEANNLAAVASAKANYSQQMEEVSIYNDIRFVC